MVVEDRKGPRHAFCHPAGREIRQRWCGVFSLAACHIRNGRSVEMGASGSPSLLAVYNDDCLPYCASGLALASLPDP